MLEAVKTWMERIEGWMADGCEGHVPIAPLNELADHVREHDGLDELQTLTLIDELKMWRERAAMTGQWQCSVAHGGCGAWVHDAQGADDDSPNICDDCWARIHGMSTSNAGPEVFRS